MSAELLAALLAGLLGSGHCALMCGGIAGVVCARQRRAQWQSVIIFNLGRIGSYTLAGALVGGLSGWLLGSENVAASAQVLRIALGVIFIVIGLHLLLKRNLLAFLEWPAKVVWRGFAPWARRLNQRHDRGSLLLLGGLWGWIPCGMTYAMLVVATTSTSSFNGALIMLAFGLGTLPALVGIGLSSQTIHHWSGNLDLKKVAASIFIVAGLWTSLAAANILQDSSNSHHHGKHPHARQIEP